MARKEKIVLGTLRVTYRNGEMQTFSLGLVRQDEVAAATAQLQGRGLPGPRGRGERGTNATEIKLAYYRVRENLSGITPLGALTLDPAPIASMSIIRPVEVEITR